MLRSQRRDRGSTPRGSTEENTCGDYTWFNSKGCSQELPRLMEARLHPLVSSFWARSTTGVQRLCKPKVAGSNPAVSTVRHFQLARFRNRAGDLRVSTEGSGICLSSDHGWHTSLVRKKAGFDSLERLHGPVVKLDITPGYEPGVLGVRIPPGLPTETN